MKRKSPSKSGSRPRRRYELKDPELNRLIEELVERAQAAHGDSEGAEYVRQLIVTALRLVGDGTPRGNVKLINSALKELRHSFRVFAPYEQLRKVAVFGSKRSGRRNTPMEDGRTQCFSVVQRRKSDQTRWEFGLIEDEHEFLEFFDVRWTRRPRLFQARWQNRCGEIRRRNAV